MKRYSTLIGILVCLILYSCTGVPMGTICTPPKIENGRLNGILPIKDKWVHYSYLVDTKGLSKEEIYRRARRWMARYYKSSKDALQMEDKVSGDLVSNSSMSFHSKTPFTELYSTLRFSLSVEAREEKCRIEITTISSVADVYTGIGSSAYWRSIETPIEQYCNGRKTDVDHVFADVDEKLKDVIEQLSKAINSPDEW